MCCLGRLYIIKGNSKDDFRLVRKIKNHSARAWDVKFSCKNRYLASSSDDKTVIIRRGYNFTPLKIITHHDVTRELSFSLDEKMIATSCWDMSAYVWSLPRAEPIVQLKDHMLYVQAALFLPNGHVVTTSADKTIGVWDLKEGGRIAKLGE